MAASSSGGGGGGGVAAAPSSVASKCYNAECKELRPDRPRKGWRLRAGDFADLCDRCGKGKDSTDAWSIYEEGKFCEISTQMHRVGGVVNHVGRSGRGEADGTIKRVPAPQFGNTSLPEEDGHTWRKYGQKIILGSKFPR
ncbi:hypothetical protein MLD38_036963 [Melastoma candidum]|uniref:Uncharacterized protein n=1 Tax=Melastoma candidum TaxID=119954 RepID=A0ACB9LLI5_9MYRT|nr:hypothetical protein MLD38_036963 [Melastoma candidum]